MSKTFLAFVFLCLVAPANVLAEKPAGSVYLDGGESSYGLILAHGQGKHPTWLVVDPVRKGIHNKLGYHTLSIQMPTGYSDWRDYADAFPEAFQTIDDAIAYLKNEKGITHIYLFGHSMGGRMSSAYVAEHPDSGLAALIVAGCRNNGGKPLACDENLQDVSLPVLDIWGAKNVKDTSAAAERSGMTSATYTQVEIPKANHKFEGHEDELVEAVADWLQQH